MARRKLLLLTLPITATMWLIGWLLSCAGSDNNKNKPKENKTTPLTTETRASA